MSYLLDQTYKRRTNLKAQKQIVLTFLKTISAEVQSLTVTENFYKLLWKKKNGVFQSKMFSSLPYSIKSEISLDINIKFLQTSTLFKDKSEAFLRLVATLIEHETYQKDELIYYRNVIKDKMVFVVSGTIELLADEDDESTIFALNPGSCIGESALVLNLPAKSSVRAASYTELQVLYKKDFYTMIDLFPLIYKNMRETILQRITKPGKEEKLERIEMTPFLADFETTPTIELKNKLRESASKTENDQYLSMYRIADNVEKTEDSSLCMSKNFPWILHPNSSLRQSWEYLILILALFINITYPYYIIFVKEYPYWFEFLSTLVDLIFTLDLAIILTTAIEEKDQTIKTFLDISQKRVIQIGFYFDFLSCIKLELFYWIWTRNRRYKDVLKLNRLLKIYRIPKLIREFENKIDNNFQIISVVKYIFYLIFVTYWFGAFLYLTTCLEDLCTADGWFFMKLMNDVKQELTSSYTSNEVLTSIYFSVSCLTGLTPGEILPQNITDTVIVCLGFILGFFIFTCCVAQLSANLTRRHKIRLDFQEVLFLFLKSMKEKNMPTELVYRIKNYFVTQWYYDKASVLKEQDLLFSTNKNFQTTVQIDEKLETLMSLSLFEEVDLDFLFVLTTKAKTLVLPPNEYVTYKGEILKILYIIKEGYCLRQFEKSYVILKPKSFFGTMCLFTNVNSLCTVKTLTHVKLLCITEEAFWKVASSYPGIVKIFKDTTEDFDIVEEFKKIEILPNDAKEVREAEDEALYFEGSFVNVSLYSKEHEEKYGEPFRQLGIMCWVQALLLPICILPYGSFLKFWMGFRIFIAFVIALLVPYYLVQIPYAPTLDKILLSADIITYIDLYVMLLVGYYGPKNQLIIHPLKTALHYIKGKFVLDLLLCFPWEIIVSHPNENPNEPISQNILDNLPNIVKIVRVGQIYRLVQYFDHVTYIRRTVNSNIFQILKFIPITLILINFRAAILIANSCKYYSEEDLANSVYNNSFVKPEGLANHPVKDFAMYCNEDSWVDRSTFRNLTEVYQVYILSIYYLTGVLTSCGLGDITPKYPSTLIITVIMSMAGIFFIGYVYAKISSQKAHWYKLLFKNQEMINEFRKFMQQEDVPLKLQNQIIDRLEFKWKRTKTVETSDVLAKLHPALYEDTVYAMFENTLKNVPIFLNVDKPFLRVFGKMIKEKYYLRQEVLCRADDVVSDICIIQRGMVKLVSKSHEIEIYMEEGGIFGNLSKESRHRIGVTVTAMSNVDVLHLDTEAFYAAMEKYPWIKETIEANLFPRRNDYILPSMATTSIDLKSDTESTLQPVRSSIMSFKNNICTSLQICLPWKLFRETVPKDSFLVTLFDIFILMLTYISSLFVIYEFSFQDHPSYLVSFAIFADVVFIIKIIFEMHKTYENRFGEVVTSNIKILKRYFNNKKWKRGIDFMVNFPFYYFLFGFSLFTSASVYLPFSSLRLITLYRLSYFFDYYSVKCNQLSVNRFLLKICATLIWGTLVIHIFACGWYPLTFCFEDSWVNEPLIHDLNKFDIYINSVYFILTILTTTGSGDIVAHNVKEQIYTSVIMISSIFCTGIFIGEIWNFLNSTTIAKVRYDYDVKELKQHVENMKISKFQLKKMWRYVQQIWSVCHGNQVPRALSLLHPATVQDLMAEIYGHHITKSYIFADVEPAFVRQLCQYLKQAVFLDGNYIIQHGDFDNTMYFIHYGEVEILTVHPNLTETIHEVLHSDDMFGVVQGLYLNVPHHFSFRARTTVHLVCLRLSDWEHLLQFFPESRDSIFTKTNRVNV